MKLTSTLLKVLFYSVSALTLVSAPAALYSHASSLSSKSSCDRHLSRPALAIQQTIRVAREEGVTDQQIRERLALLGSVNQMVGKDLALPKTVHFTILKNDSNAHSAMLGTSEFELVVPVFLSFTENGQKHPKFSLSVLAHEYGHSIFDTNLELDETFKKEFSLYFEFQAKAAEFNLLVEAFNEIQPRLEELMKLHQEGKPYDEKEFKDLIDKAEAINAKYEVLEVYLTENEPAFMEQSDLLGGYHEFFADVISVTYTRDPKAIFNSLYSPTLKTAKPVEGEEPINYREMKESLTLRRFDKKVWSRNYTHSESHISLSPARAHIWKYYISNAWYYGDDSRFIKTVFESIKSEILARKVEGKIQGITPEEANERLMARLDQDLPKIKTAQIGGKVKLGSNP